MKNRIILALLVCSIGLTACGEKPRPVQYYKDNPNEIKAVHDRCQDTVKKGSVPDAVLKQNCENASKAMVDNLKNAIAR